MSSRNRSDRRSKTRPPIAHNNLSTYMHHFLEWCAAKGLSPRTLEGRDTALHRFIVWCDERDIDHPATITLPILERYQKHLYYYRKPNGEPLGYSSQHALLTPLKAWFKWLTRDRHILYNPASELELPKVPKGLPRVVLSVEEVERILTAPNTEDPSGVRDRAILELFYGTGIRRMEMANLSLYDLNPSRKTLLVREGKGRKDRLLPVGDRALHWAERYRREVRPELVSGKDSGHLFLTDQGQPWAMGYLTTLVRKYLRQTGLKKSGACHLFRHAMATHMLDNGADIRYIQTMLGHAELSTTQIYTQVSIEKLREVHRATHPAKLEDERAALLEALDLEADDD
ncbi:site-specific tyrosine recombinase XerC [Microbulbifer sp. SSSA003]|uniref:site-specific tyrosine recombinase XerC n=1 Tax=Microbulbifer sp. SSSA003 TaxID=3243377 RepID=UPI00403A1CDC